MHPAQGSRLDSWKLIAEYLGRNVRTVTRWADERDLPVHRVPGGKRGAVFAFTDEIDAWLLKQRVHEPESSIADHGAEGGSALHASSVRAAGKSRSVALVQYLTPRWRWALVAGSVLVVALGFLATLRPGSSHASQLFSIKHDVDTLEALDAEGHTLWNHRYSHPFYENYFRSLPGAYTPARIADFFHDGKKEVATIVPLHSGLNPSDIVHTEVDFFSGEGKLLWSYAPDKTFKFGTHELKAPWAFFDLLVSQSSSQTTLWITASHHTWGNAFVSQLDPRTGHEKLRFVNTGVLYRLNELKTAGATYLLAGGFNNEWDGGSLAIINEDRPFAASPQTPATRHFCDSCSSGVPDYYFVFPRSEINRISRIYQDPVFDIQISDDGIEVRKYERFTKGGENTIYLLSPRPPFKLLSLRYDSDYDMLHRAWSAEGKLLHTLENCPERLHPRPVRLWTPGHGWSEIDFKAARATD